MYQEIFVRLRFPEGTKINERTFAWRKINFDKLMIKDVRVSEEGSEVSFTSEFNAEFSKEQIESLMREKFSFTTGDGISAAFLKDFEVVEIKEEAEIYGNK